MPESPMIIPAAALAGGVYARAQADVPWTSAGRAGLRLAMVYGDREKGRFLGLIGFDPMTCSGLHQHLGPAISYFLAGSLDDYAGPMKAGFGINLKGATHDAISYDGCVLVSRLEAPVIYPEETPAELDLHHGSQRGAIVNPNPEMPPDINLPLSMLPARPTRLAGITRRDVFDYHGTGTDRRCCMLAMLPGSGVPAFETSAPLDIFVVAGDLTAKPARGPARRAEGAGFVVVEPGARINLQSEFGANLIIWSEAPVRMLRGGRDPFGF